MIRDDSFKMLESLVALVSVGDSIIVKSSIINGYYTKSVTKINENYIEFDNRITRVNYYRIGNSGGWDLLENGQLVYYN